MQYLCSQCRRPLQMSQTMCACGQVFPRVPEYNPDSLSSFWPPAADSRPAILKWWDDISMGAKAAVAGGAVLIMAVIAVGGTVGHYNTMHARYSPGAPVMAASAVPVHVQAPAAAPTGPLMPAPMILRAEPRYVPPTKSGSSAYASSQGQPQQGVMMDTSDPLKPTPEQMAAEKRYNDARGDAQQQENYLQQTFGNGVETQQIFNHGEMGNGFGSNVKIMIGNTLARMRQDLDVMQQNFSSMSPSTQAIANPSSTGIPSSPMLTGEGAQEHIQNTINKWTPYCQ